MKKTFTTLLAVLFANIIAVQAARAAIYEAPFVGELGQVSGSEGKVNEDASYKVEILTGSPNTTYAICTYDLTNGTVFLTDVTTDEDGELKVIGTLSLLGSYPGFSFIVYSTAGACTPGSETWISGFTL